MTKFFVGLFTGILLTIVGYIGLMEYQGMRSAKKFLACYELGFQEEAKQNPFITFGCFMKWQMFDQTVRNNLTWDTKLDRAYVQRKVNELNKKYEVKEIPNETLPE